MSTQAGHLGQQGQPSSLEKPISPQLLGEVRDFWFSHLESEDAAILPGFNEMKRWFMGGEELDTLCSERFKPVLEAIKSSNATPEAIISDASPSDPGDWLALVLLLDQFPRNCYRGPSASLVFLIFDPLAQAVARKAIDLGIPISRDIRYHLSRRMWFYLPLMHSEDLTLHNHAVAEYERMSRDFKTLMTSSPVNDAAEERCRQVLATDKEATEKILASNLDFEIKHREIIVRFGRYPHRNGPLGREMSADEQKYLDEGGETFSASASKS
ncbi:hypothetical protein VDGD_10466 [Verticillium dahliae]|nr:hypothetical protein VdG1_06125 [Verticillium dahliae VDG1]RBQ90577.1 hypothetical protein VDGD_10466 [Verticillium dahliae]